MQISVTFRHMDSSDALRNHAIEKTDRIRKYFDEPTEAHVLLSMERYLYKAEINLSAHGMMICSKVVSSDMYNSIDRAIEKIETQVKRYRDRLIKLRPKDGAKIKMRFKLLEGSAPEEEVSALPPTIIESQDFEARPMLVEEAVMQMDLLDNDVLVFLNVKTDHINVLYRKKGNKYGLIETH